MNRNDIFITTGNARAWESEILPRDVGILKIKEIQKGFELERWADEDRSRTRIMAECLIPDRVQPEYLQVVYVVSQRVANNVKARYPDIKIAVIPEPYMFFRPAWYKPSNNMGVVKGNIFFSRMRNSTAIVNTSRVKSYNLAIGIKYHLVGVHHKYQQNELVTGKPYTMKKRYLIEKVHWI